MPIEPKGIIIHSMGEYIKTDKGPVCAHDFLMDMKLSVHGFIHPDGDYEKMVDSPNKAYHAGKSEWGGLTGLNSHYLGFELLVAGEHDYASFSKAIHTPGTYSKEQFDTALEVCKWWMEKYNIPIENVIRHSDCSGDDVRGEGKGKNDPGTSFEWERFKYELGE
jgi:N-acetylmuramoyl-L-alanine amidase